MTIEAKLEEGEWGNATPGKSPIALLTPNVTWASVPRSCLESCFNVFSFTVCLHYSSPIILFTANPFMASFPPSVGVLKYESALLAFIC